MRDRSKEIAMLEDTLKILNQGWYEKNGKRIHQWRWEHLSEPLPF